MLRALGRAAREARLAAGLKQIDVAIAAGVSHNVISRLEQGRRYPELLDEVIAAYEVECGLRSGELWKRAARRL